MKIRNTSKGSRGFFVGGRSVVLKPSEVSNDLPDDLGKHLASRPSFEAVESEKRGPGRPPRQDAE